jgi:hypothetical protein
MYHYSKQNNVTKKTLGGVIALRKHLRSANLFKDYLLLMKKSVFLIQKNYCGFFYPKPRIISLKIITLNVWVTII